MSDTAPKNQVVVDSFSNDEKSVNNSVNRLNTIDNSSDSDVSLQHGVQVAEALRSAWSKKALIIAYCSIFFLFPNYRICWLLDWHIHPIRYLFIQGSLYVGNCCRRLQNC